MDGAPPAKTHSPDPEVTPPASRQTRNAEQYAMLIDWARKELSVLVLVETSFQERNLAVLLTFERAQTVSTIANKTADDVYVYFFGEFALNTPKTCLRFLEEQQQELLFHSHWDEDVVDPAVFGGEAFDPKETKVYRLLLDNSNF